MRFSSSCVADVFSQYPQPVHDVLLFLRRLIFDVAEQTDGVGVLEEALRWGEPAYLTSQSKSGSTIRINRVKNSTTHVAMYFNCQTSLVDMFKELYGDVFCYEKNRAIIFDVSEQIPVKPLKHCIYLALTYHLRKG